MYGINRLHSSLIGVHVHLLSACRLILGDKFGLFEVDDGVFFQLLPLDDFDEVAGFGVAKHRDFGGILGPHFYLVRL